MLYIMLGVTLCCISLRNGLKWTNIFDEMGQISQGGVGIKKRHLGSNFSFQRQDLNLPTT